MSLRNKALGFAIALGTLPVVLCGGMAYHFTNNNIKNSEIKFQESSAMSLSSKVNSFLFERYGDVQAIANLPMLTNPEATEGLTSQAKQKVINKYLDIYKVYDSIAVFDLNGNAILQSSGSPVSNHKNRDYFQQVLKINRRGSDSLCCTCKRYKYRKNDCYSPLSDANQSSRYTASRLW